jgi:hypothetical protein
MSKAYRNVIKGNYAPFYAPKSFHPPLTGLISMIYIEKEEFEDTRKVIRIRKSKKDIQYNGRKKKDKMKINDLENTI